MKAASHTADAIVIGAGIVGASLRLAPRRARTVRHRPGTRGRSRARLHRPERGRGAGPVHHPPQHRALDVLALPIYRHFPERHGFEVGYRDIGYLLLAPPDRWERHLDSVALQHSLGAPVDVLTPDEALRYVPLATNGLAGATYGPWDGVIDPHMATHADDGFTEGVDWSWLERVLLTGVERYPWWEDLGIDRKGSWWGYYGVTPDNSPVIGFNPGTRGWVDACGFSGHGIMPWVFRSRHYPLIDGEAEREVKLRILEVLFSDVVPTPRDVVIICLADACGIFTELLSKREVRHALPRIELIRKMDLIGRAVTAAIWDIEVSLALAIRPHMA